MVRGICAVLLALALGLPARADERPLYRYAAQLGVGNHYGIAGVGFTWRFDPRFAAVIGAGMWGPAGAARYYPYGPLFVQAGVSPLAHVEDGPLFYGPDLMAGADLRRARVSFTAGLGCSALILVNGRRELSPSLDIGVGVNFGPAGATPPEEAP